jgi:hypothetical protein
VLCDGTQLFLCLSSYLRENVVDAERLLFLSFFSTERSCCQSLIIKIDLPDYCRMLPIVLQCYRALSCIINQAVTQITQTKSIIWGRLSNFLWAIILTREFATVAVLSPVLSANHVEWLQCGCALLCLSGVSSWNEPPTMSVIYKSMAGRT